MGLKGRYVLKYERVETQALPRPCCSTVCSTIKTESPVMKRLAEFVMLGGGGGGGGGGSGKPSEAFASSNRTLTTQL